MNDNNYPILSGFIYEHGENDLSVWTVNLAPDDIKQIEKILQKYECGGYSVRNCYESKFSDIF